MELPLNEAGRVQKGQVEGEGSCLEFAFEHVELEMPFPQNLFSAHSMLNPLASSQCPILRFHV